MKFNSKKKYRLFVALLVLAAAAGVYDLLRGRDITIPSLFQPKQGVRLLMSMDGFRFAQSEDGRVSWRMRAASADLYENKEAQLKDIEISYTGAQNGYAAEMFGEAGMLDTASGNASLRRGVREVRIVTHDGYLLTTDSLFWRAGDRLVRTEDPFKLLGREIYLEGRGITANVDMRTFEVRDNVKAVLQE
jgi:LPS export ABC transporter protein LptC